MKNSIKNLFKKNTTFLKKAVNSFKSTFKKYPKTLSFIALMILIAPIAYVEAGAATKGVKYGAILAGALAVGMNALDIGVSILTMLKTLAATIVYAAGLFFDNLLIISLSREMYDSEWIKLGWSLIRDIANIAFILGIVIIGIFMILGKTAEWRKMLINLIIVVFIMNFSIFFARVVIDAGNFTAAIFYSMSSVKDESNKGEDFKVATDTSSWTLIDDRLFIARAVLGKGADWKEPFFGSRSIATGLIAFVNPTGLYSSGAENLSNSGEKGIKQTLIILNIVFILVMIWMSKALIRASFMFVARTIHLIKLIISAPVYFAWYFLPSGSGKLNEWFGEIIGKSFCVTSYMIGLWILFLFLANDSMRETLNGIGSSSPVTLIVLVAIKFLIIYMALEKLTEMGSKSCDSGDFGKGFANNVGKVTAFVGGGFIGKMASAQAKNSARSIVGSRGQSLREMGGRWGDSKSAAGRWIGDKMLAGGNTLYGAKIGGQSFKEEVDLRQKREGEMLNMLTKEEKEKRFYNQQGGKNAEFVGTKKKRKEILLKISEMSKKKNDKVRDMKNAGVDKNTINNFISKEREKIDKFKNKNINIVSTNQERFERMSEKEKIKYVNQNPQGLKEKKTLFAELIGAAEHEEAANQVLGKRSVDAVLKREKKALEKKDKKIRDKYIEKETEINEELYDNKEKLSRAEKKNVSSLDDLSEKFREMYEVLGEDVSSLNNQEVRDKIKNDSRFEDNDFLDEEKMNEYIHDKTLIRRAKETLSDDQNELRILKTNDIDEKEQVKEQSQKAKDAIEELKKYEGMDEASMSEESKIKLESLRLDSKDVIVKEVLTETAKKTRLKIAKMEKVITDKEKYIKDGEKDIEKAEKDITKVFDKGKDILKNKADAEKKTLKEKYSDDKNEISEKKSGLDKESTQVKDNIASGIHTHNPNRHNINEVITHSN